MAIIVYIHGFDCFCTLNSSWTLSGSFVNEVSCYCHRGCHRNIPCLSANKGCHVLVYGWFLSSTTHIAEDARPNTVDAPLTLICKLGQEGYCYLFFEWMRQIIPLRQSGTYRPSDYPGCMTKNHWHSSDSHFQHAVGSMSLQFLSIKMANTTIMYNHHQIHFWLPDLQDQKLLTLRWCSFCHRHNCNMPLFDLF